MTPRRLGIDIDGVLADFTYPVARLASELFGISVSGYATTWNWMQEYGVTGDREKELWEYLTSHPEWWGNLPLLQGADVPLRHLHTLNESMQADVYFITTRPGAGVKLATEVWLQSHGFLNPTVLIASKKGPIAEGLKLDFFIDDKPENCYDVRPFVARTFLPIRPWNVDRATVRMLGDYDITRVNELSDALSLAGFSL